MRLRGINSVLFISESRSNSYATFRIVRDLNVTSMQPTHHAQSCDRFGPDPRKFLRYR